MNFHEENQQNQTSIQNCHRSSGGFKFKLTFNLSLRYKISLLKPSTKALQLSSKISIRMDNRGFLSLQYMIVNEDGQVCFVEYLVSSLHHHPIHTTTTALLSSHTLIGIMSVVFAMDKIVYCSASFTFKWYFLSCGAVYFYVFILWM